MRTGLFSACLAMILVAAGSSISLAAMNPFGATGLPLNKADYQEISKAAQPLLNDETVAIGASHDWANPKSGNHGSVKLLDRFATHYQGTTLPCRKLEYTVSIKGRSDPYNLVLDRCKTSDGIWKIF